ncbi:dehydrogenase/reductase SDR family member 12-like [Ylistrum balloti]|uniref:dehydrogenase/reductase SDR family member 12-like n=1 Tax=Ylistrum balloti TaxID=509963 RepID=UPI002905AC60|nr:dehydrogenase/reductase SDR family member 12-like [Ylistrum balloti]XP_060073049.1 dehydrogenase/reductase SDR family member 12-like [Ylistrum balloti]
MSFFRNAVWFMKGLKEYTKGGYASASKDFKASDLDVDVSGRSYMITGANSGIGKCAAVAIAKKGGTVHMVCRDPKRGEEARQAVKEESQNQDVQLHILDMSKPRDVARFAQNFISSGKPLNVLINNAGCMVNTRTVNSEDGLERNFSTNTLGVHMLTTALIPLLSKQEKSRVVTVTSGGMLVQKLNGSDLQFEKMNPFDGTMAYAQNKRQQVVMTEQYAKKYPDIHFSCMHPGWADTPAVQNSMPDFYEKMKTRLRTPEEGADTVVWLAVSDSVPSLDSGLFYQDRQSVSKHLPLAWTKSTADEETTFMQKLDNIAQQFLVESPDS